MDGWETSTTNVPLNRLDSKYIDSYWKKRGGKQQGNSKSGSHAGKRKMDIKATPNHKMSRRKGNSDEPLLMLDVTHNIRKHKHRHTVKQQPSTSKPISTPPSSSSPPSPSAASEQPPIIEQPITTSNSKSTPPSSPSSPSTSKQQPQLKSILKKRRRLTRKDLSSITSDLSTFDFDALTLSPTPPSSTTRRQQQPSSSSPSTSTQQPQQVPSVSFSEPLQDPARSSSSSLTPEPEALVPRVKRTVEFTTPTPTSVLSPEDDTSHHHAPAASLNQSIQQQHADRTIQPDLYKGQEVIFDLDFRSELSYDWESEIQCVETVIKIGALLYAIVRWKDNALAMYPTQLIQRRCHMKVRENMHKPSGFFFGHLVIFLLRFCS